MSAAAPARYAIALTLVSYCYHMCKYRTLHPEESKPPGSFTSKMKETQYKSPKRGPKNERGIKREGKKPRSNLVYDNNPPLKLIKGLSGGA